jgi:addiction module RelE/StbE family toxin
MEWNLIWSVRATQELHNIRRYIATDNEAAAERLVRQILERLEAVRKIPTIGPLFQDQQGRTLRQIVVGKYRIIYHVNVDQAQVEVLTVWHGARREPDLG